MGKAIKLVPKIKRYKDGTADWKSEYDNLFEKVNSAQAIVQDSYRVMAGLIADQVKQRQRYKDNKDYKKADTIREELSMHGVIIQDKGNKVRWFIAGTSLGGFVPLGDAGKTGVLIMSPSERPEDGN